MLLYDLRFDKLEVIKNELAMIDEQWSEWSFTQFLEVLEKWTLNNPLYEDPRSKNMGGHLENKKQKKKKVEIIFLPTW